MYKKFIGIILSLVIFSQSMIVYGNDIYQENNNDILVHLVEENTLSTFSDENVQLLSNYMSYEDIKKLEQDSYEMDKIEAKNGGVNIKTEIIIEKESRSLSSNGIKKSIVRNEYAYPEKILNKKDDNIIKLLDMFWNYYVGTKTSYTWQAISILGLSPSTVKSFLPNGQSQKLSSTMTKIVERNCYSKYNKTQNRDVWYYETRKEIIQNFVDLYVCNKNSNRYERYSQMDDAAFTSNNFYNESYIINYVNNACANNSLIVGYDKIP